MQEEEISRKHRVLDDTDLRDINNTFLLIKSDIQSRSDRLDVTLKALKDNMDTKFESINFRFTILQWAIGFLIAGIVAICIKLFV